MFRDLSVLGYNSHVSNVDIINIIKDSNYFASNKIICLYCQKILVFEHASPYVFR